MEKKSLGTGLRLAKVEGLTWFEAQEPYLKHCGGVMCTNKDTFGSEWCTALHTVWVGE